MTARRGIVGGLTFLAVGVFLVHQAAAAWRLLQPGAGVAEAWPAVGAQVVAAVLVAMACITLPRRHLYTPAVIAGGISVCVTAGVAVGGQAPAMLAATLTVAAMWQVGGVARHLGSPTL